MGTFSIRVVDQNGEPMRGIRVGVSWGFWSGGLHEYTDDNGWVSFDNSDDSLTSAEFFIKGDSVGEHTTYSGETYSFSIED